ncbi:MAG: DinB family protein [Bacteroidia bacterium]|nr:DinB family protein [Bacteroidia bacterium]
MGYTKDKDVRVMLYKEIDHRLQHQHLELKFLLKDLDQDFVMKQHSEGKWSIHENLAHLGRYQEVLLERLKRILKEDSPHCPRYHAEEDPNYDKWVKKSTEVILEDIFEKRKQLKRFIEGLTSQQLIRKGLHPLFLDMTILQWTQFFLLHESHHIYTIFRVKRVNGK